MQRRKFIGLAAAGITGLSMNTISDLAKWAAGLKPAERVPALFVGHGSPMNAIEDNTYSQSWRELGKNLPRPRAILCISAHWQSRGVKVTAMERPRTIYDMYGFPPELYEVTYPAPGAPELIPEIQSVVSVPVHADHEWGLDHGTWSVLHPMLPKADIPVLQLSLDVNISPEEHLALGKELAALRDKGVMLVGSGNVVHNLGRIDWNGGVHDWALEFDGIVKDRVEKGDYQSLAKYEALGASARLSIPTNEHYLPLLYILGAQKSGEEVMWFNDSVDLGALSMRSLIWA